jgi:hypothetical protein
MEYIISYKQTSQLQKKYLYCPDQSQKNKQEKKYMRQTKGKKQKNKLVSKKSSKP